MSLYDQNDLLIAKMFIRVPRYFCGLDSPPSSEREFSPLAGS